MRKKIEPNYFPKFFLVKSPFSHQSAHRIETSQHIVSCIFKIFFLKLAYTEIL